MGRYGVGGGVANVAQIDRQGMFLDVAQQHEHTAAKSRTGISRQKLCCLSDPELWHKQQHRTALQHRKQHTNSQSNLSSMTMYECKGRWHTKQDSICKHRCDAIAQWLQHKASQQHCQHERQSKAILKPTVFQQVQRTQPLQKISGVC